MPAFARFEPVVCKNSFTVEQEQTEGAKVALEIYKQMPVLPDSDPVSRYVQRLGAKLVDHAPGYRWPYNFHVVASEEINAFALPGGAIFVNLGTVQVAATEAQLAGVIAHEVSHVVQRHSTCNITAQQRKSLWYGLGQIAAGTMIGGDLGNIAAQGIGSVAGLDFLHMSRDAEKQADLLGAGILYDTGYDPRGLPQFFEAIQAKYGAGGAQLLSDHPNPGNRTEYVNAEIATLPRRNDSTVTTTEFMKVHAVAMQQKTYAAKDVQAGGWRKTGMYSGGPGAGAGVVAAPVTAGTAQPVGSGPVSSATPTAAVRLNVASLSCGNLVKLQGPRFTISYPPCWKGATDQSGGATIAPSGGAVDGGVTYGAVVGFEKQGGDGIADAESLQVATTALAKRLSDQNGGLQQVGQLRAMTIGRQIANAVELRGKSAVVDGGRQLAERDWLVTVARPDGDMNYMVLVAPEPDFEALRGLFTSMMQSFRAQ